MSRYDYDWWRAALAGEKIGGPKCPVHDGDAQPGFWRKRESRAGKFLPVAIWRHDGCELVAIVDGHVVDPGELWSYVCRYPVTEEAYRIRVDSGKWPDEDEAVNASLEPPAGVGHNEPPTDPRDILDGQITAALGAIHDYDSISSDEQASKAQSVRSRLLELSNQADKEREKVTKPLVDEQRRVNGLWMPLVRAAKEGADAVRTAMSRYETDKEKKARAAALALAREAEKSAAPVEQAPPEPTQVRGAYGRAATKKMVKKAKITDYDKAVVGLKAHPEMKELVAKLAQRAVDAGIPVDGVEFDEVVDVR